MTAKEAAEVVDFLNNVDVTDVEKKMRKILCQEGEIEEGTLQFYTIPYEGAAVDEQTLLTEEEAWKLYILIRL